MRKHFSWLVVLGVLGLAVAPEASYAQEGGGLDVPPPTTIAPWFIGGNNLSQGGWYIAGEFMYLRQTNPMKDEPVAFRGIYDADGSIGQALGIGSTPGQFIGSHAVALDTNQVAGPTGFTPGFKVTLGYRFESGLDVEVSWIHLADARYSATAGILPPTQIGAAAEETFLTSPVYNFTPSYFGPGNTAVNAQGDRVGSAIAMFGLWDGDSQQTISFVQRFDQGEMTFRFPMQETEEWRMYGLVGPRLVTMWERFTWTAVHSEADGSVEPQDSANYTNVVSNRLYGAFAGVGNEWLLADTHAGAFSLSVDAEGALFVDFVKGRPKYELGDRSTAAQHGIDFANLVPEVSADVSLRWYPYHGIECKVGYNFMAFFNTISSPQPIDFNFGSITPNYLSTIRLFDGVSMGVSFIF